MLGKCWENMFWMYKKKTDRKIIEVPTAMKNTKGNNRNYMKTG